MLEAEAQTWVIWFSTRLVCRWELDRSALIFRSSFSSHNYKLSGCYANQADQLCSTKLLWLYAYLLRNSPVDWWRFGGFSRMSTTGSFSPPSAVVAISSQFHIGCKDRFYGLTPRLVVAGWIEQWWCHLVPTRLNYVVLRRQQRLIIHPTLSSDIVWGIPHTFLAGCRISCLKCI